MDAIEIKGLDKRFNLKEKGFFNLNKKEFYALRNINLKIKKGDFLGVIGPNGAGKSTLLKLISGILKPTSGKISVNGDLLSFIELGVGMNEELTGRENAFLYGSLLGLSKKYINDNLNSITDFSGVGSFFDEKLRTYSSGMKIRLAFSIAALCQPDILLVDEIISVGDEEFQEKSIRHIKNLNMHGTTVLLVSHDLGRVSEVCKEVISLNKGKIIFKGSPSEAIYNYYTQISEKNTLDTKKEFVEKLKLLENLKKEHFKKNGQKVSFFFGLIKKTEKKSFLDISIDEGKVLNSLNHKLGLYLSELNLLNLKIERNDSPKSLYDIKRKSSCLEIIGFLLSAKFLIDKREETKIQLVGTLKDTVKSYDDIILYNSTEKRNKLSEKKESAKISKENAEIKSKIINLYKELDVYIEKKSLSHKPKGSTFGSKEAEIKSVKFYNKKNVTTNRFYTNGYFKTEIQFECQKKVKKPMIGIAIHTKEGILITGPNTTFSNCNIPFLEKKGKINFIVEELPLLEGEYDFSASIYDFLGEKPIDHHYRLYSFSVFNDKNMEKYGVVQMKHKWEIFV